MKSTNVTRTLLFAGCFAASSVALAQAPAGQPAASPAVKPEVVPKAAPAGKAGASTAAPAAAPPALAPQATAAAAAAVPPQEPAPGPAAAAGTPAATPALPAAPPFPTQLSEADTVYPNQPAVAHQGSGPRVVGVQTVEPQEPPPPPKTKFPIGLELNFMPVWQTGAGYDLFSRNDISTRIGLAADVELLDIADRTPLAVEAGWSTESQSESSLDGALDAEMTAHNLHGGLKVRHELFSFLSPHLHVAAGATRLKTEFSTFGAGATRDFESHEWLAFGFAGAGVTASIPAPLVVRPGLSLEGGYLVSQSMPLRLEPTWQGLATSGASLGTLERSGPYLRIGIFLRY